MTTAAQQIWADIRAQENEDGDFTRAQWDWTDPSHRKVFTNQVAIALRDGIVTDGELHNLKVSALEADGWTYGPVRNFNRKVSPEVVPFAAVDTKRLKSVIAQRQALERVKSTSTATEIKAITDRAPK